ncbi:ferrous iron transport protein A [Methanoplanus sp. FWC-SCC4]|uniref:Ferrous iron transport protein A n=1 Tax=Methanochimaera problematica TaxID=2609417 RepID=A0AA97I3A2_9EURY|nr:FeoA family protein [Methanoplanus sp. FWC-SCC4]WOF15671.1 ferrous iron transport protein A [Methanoplanus sp. FWC-SCC4]
MIIKASELKEEQSGIINEIRDYKSDLECMGIQKGDIIKKISKPEDNGVIVIKNTKNNNEIILVSGVAENIFIKPIPLIRE